MRLPTTRLRTRPENERLQIPSAPMARALAFSLALHLAILSLTARIAPPIAAVSQPPLPALEAEFQAVESVSAVLPMPARPMTDRSPPDKPVVVSPLTETVPVQLASAHPARLMVQAIPVESPSQLKVERPSVPVALPAPIADLHWYEVRQLDVLPRPMHAGKPEYPPKARLRGVDGWVKARLRIDERGQVLSVEVLESSDPELFDEAVLRFYTAQAYSPALRNGQPVRAKIDQRIRFSQE